MKRGCFYLFINLIYFIKNLIEAYLIYNVVLVSGVQQSDSVLYMCIYILFDILFHYSLSQDIDYNSLCYTIGPCCLFILYIIVYIC